MKGWERQEQRLAKAIGGTRNAGSGAFDRKGDVRSSDLHVEAKWTGNKQITVKSSVLEENFREAVIEGRTPVIAIELNGRNYVILEEADFLEQHEYAQAFREERGL